jgi:hypothetical protein
METAEHANSSWMISNGYEHPTSWKICGKVPFDHFVLYVDVCMCLMCWSADLCVCVFVCTMYRSSHQITPPLMTIAFMIMIMISTINSTMTLMLFKHAAAVVDPTWPDMWYTHHDWLTGLKAFFFNVFFYPLSNPFPFLFLLLSPVYSHVVNVEHSFQIRCWAERTSAEDCNPDTNTNGASWCVLIFCSFIDTQYHWKSIKYTCCFYFIIYTVSTPFTYIL